MARLPIISLYTGAGGLDLGFEAAGFETAVAVESDGRCAATLRANRPWPVIERDIAAVPTAEIMRVAKLRRGQAAALVGGPPCQPFSKAGFWATGEAGRLADPRASTLGQFFRVLAEAQPRTFLLENVEGLGFRGKDEGLRLVHEALVSINRRAGTSYSASVAVLNAADYGVPQLRRRLFIVGSRDGATMCFPEATHAEPGMLVMGANMPAWLTAWDALHDLASEASSALAAQGKWAGLLPTIPEGGNYLWHTSRGGGEPLFGWRRRYWSFLLKLAKDRPAWTLAAQPGPATGPFHWSGRRLSAREMARLQTFPDAFRLPSAIADAQRQLGNAVPSLLAEVLARRMRCQLLAASDEEGAPSLAMAPAPVTAPLPARPRRVPARYLALRGDHDDHPGTGKGYAASRRGQAASARRRGSGESASA